MKTFTINGKTYTEKQLASAIRRVVQKKDARPLGVILDEVPPEGDADPVYTEVILSIREDPVARYLAAQKLQRGIEGFGPIDPLLRIAEFLVDLYVRFRRRK